MIKYFSMDLGFVVNFSCNLDLLQSCVHFLLEVIAIFNDARLSLYDVNVGEVSRSVILSYLIIFKDDFFSYFSYDHKTQARVKNYKTKMMTTNIRFCIFIVLIAL